MNDERIVGCLPGETPAGVVLILQEKRHRAEIADLKAQLVEERTRNEALREQEYEQSCRAERAEYRVAELSKAIVWMLRVSFGRAGKIRGGHLEWWSGKQWHRTEDPGTDEERIAIVCRLAEEEEE